MKILFTTIYLNTNQFCSKYCKFVLFRHFVPPENGELSCKSSQRNRWPTAPKLGYFTTPVWYDLLTSFTISDPSQNTQNIITMENQFCSVTWISDTYLRCVLLTHPLSCTPASRCSIWIAAKELNLILIYFNTNKN